MRLSLIAVLRSKTTHIPSHRDNAQQLILLIFAFRHRGRLVCAHVEHGQRAVAARRDQMLLVREPEEIGDEVIMVSIRPDFSLT